ncbi:replication factor C large subunit [Methanosarcina sp. KYL-1]|nr:replication factor C large subunit [Methanosarcina sp. KYL-1]
MTSAIEWAEKYRPQTLADIVGNKKAVHDFRSWAEEWLSGIPEKRAVILEGPAGIGKTSSAHALARDMGWEAIELNASDQRTEAVIEKIAGSAASMNTLFGGKRLIILDEADNIHGTADRGGMRAISGIIKNTLHPIVLIANDVYGLTPTIRGLCLEIKFGSVQSRSMVPALKKVCDAEGIRCSPEAVQQIAENAGGDLRSAMNDLQAAASGRQVLEAEDISTAGRDVKDNIFKAMQKIFKSTDCKKALEASRGLDESPEDLVHWIDENLPIQYAGKGGELDDIRTGFDYLSKADLYLGRVKRRQNYRMWRYASMLMVCGASLSKSRPYPGFIKYQQPSLWKRLGQTRSKRDMRDNIASKVGVHSFESMHYSRSSLLGLYSRMLNDEAYAVDIAAGLGLELEELMYLSGSSKASKKLQKIYDEAQALLISGDKEGAREPEFFKQPEKPGKKQMSLDCPAPSEPAKKASSLPEISVVTGLDIHVSPDSEGKQRTLNFGFAASPEEPRKPETEEKKSFVGFEYVESKAFESNNSESKALECNFPDRKVSGSGVSEKRGSADSVTEERNAITVLDPVERKVPAGPPLPEKNAFTDSTFPNKKTSVVPKLSEKKASEGTESAGLPEVESEAPKKAEQKTQKTLFDF